MVENAEPDSFIEQAVEADAIFVAGGHTNALFADIAVKQGFYEAIKGKVYAGSSAGALIAEKYYFTSSANEIREGFGWLPIRLLTHYGNPDFNGTKETRQLLETYDDALELVTLSECEWRIFEI